MKQFKELSAKELQMTTGGRTDFGKCVIGAYGAAAGAALAGKGAKFGPLGMAGAALAAEVSYMADKGCFPK